MQNYISFDDKTLGYMNINEIGNSVIGKLNEMHGKLDALCKEVRYKPVVNYVNNSIKGLRTSVKPQMDNAMSEWFDNHKGSYTEKATIYHCSNEDLEIARAHELGIKEKYDNFWKENMLELIIIDKMITQKCNEEVLENLKDIYKEIIAELKKIQEEEMGFITTEIKNGQSIVIEAKKPVIYLMTQYFIEYFADRTIELKRNGQELLKIREADSRNFQEVEKNAEIKAKNINGYVNLGMFKDGNSTGENN